MSGMLPSGALHPVQRTHIAPFQRSAALQDRSSRATGPLPALQASSDGSGAGGALTACSPASRLSVRSDPASCRAVAPRPRCGPPQQPCRQVGQGRQGRGQGHGREGDQGGHGEGHRGAGTGAGHPSKLTPKAPHPRPCQQPAIKQCRDAALRCAAQASASQPPPNNSRGAWRQQLRLLAAAVLHNQVHKESLPLRSRHRRRAAARHIQPAGCRQAGRAGRREGGGREGGGKAGLRKGHSNTNPLHLGTPAAATSQVLKPPRLPSQPGAQAGLAGSPPVARTTPPSAQSTKAVWKA